LDTGACRYEKQQLSSKQRPGAFKQALEEAVLMQDGLGTKTQAETQAGTQAEQEAQPQEAGSSKEAAADIAPEATGGEGEETEEKEKEEKGKGREVYKKRGDPRGDQPEKTEASGAKRRKTDPPTVSCGSLIAGQPCSCLANSS